MEKIVRQLQIKLPAGQSAFLWGPRKTGKSTLLKDLFSDSFSLDFLDTDLYFEFSKRPALLRERVATLSQSVKRRPIILDEVQKIPHILDEVHYLIEKERLSFILCGSSARKLKKSHANMLGGRAWRLELHPLCSVEIPNLNLLNVLNRGLIPSHYLQNDEEANLSLKAYTRDYLKEEVFDEGLTRNVPAFSRFFDAIAYSHGELTNYTNIAADCGIDSKTVKEYYQILCDTLLGTFIEPFSKRSGRDIIIKSPKFYLFDCGVARTIMKNSVTEEKGAFFGKMFEHFIFLELLAYRTYSGSDFKINYWRTKSGLEVDFILENGLVAIEVKGTNRVDQADVKGLKAFSEEHSTERLICVCNEKFSRISNDIHFYPWRDFLTDLWKGQILK